MRILLVLAAAAAMMWAESAAGIKWTAPAGWVSKGEAPMRAAQYAVGDAECVVFFFGPGQGGSVDANVERWKGQFRGTGGQPAVAKVVKKTAGGVAMTTIDVAGEYSGMGGPMAAGKPVAGYRLLGAIVEGPGGNIFVKFTGPAKTIAANQLKFQQLLASFQRDK